MNDFQEIFAFVRTIPSGKVMSYGEVGTAVGVTARTVGWAMSVGIDNSTDTPVPWHRVVGADGYLRIARRSPELRAVQQSLLEAEGVTFDTRGYVLPQFFAGSEPAATGTNI